MNAAPRLASVLVASLACALSFARCAAPTPEERAARDAALPADLVIQGGKIVTLDRDHPVVEALAVHGDRIYAMGSFDDVEPEIGSGTRVIELDGKLAIPGFIESHGHFLGLGEARLEIELRDTKAWDEIAARVASAAARAQPGEWIKGRGWHQDKWDRAPSPMVEAMPTNDALNRAAPDHPVVLVHASGHACIANEKAFELAGVAPTVADPEGGHVVRDASGKPTGVLLENAMALVRDAAGLPSSRAARDAIRRRWIEVATQECLAKGVTSFADAGSPVEVVELYRELASAGELGLRMYVMVNDSNDVLREKLAAWRTIGANRGFLTVRAIKRVFDGALGSHGAWLLEPYSDLPSTCGFATTSVDSLRETAELASNYGYQLCVHAIGDRANRECLDVFASVLGSRARELDHRWRIEHAQHLSPSDVPRFAELGVIASMQAIHCTSDGAWVPTRLGARRAEEGAYVWRALIDSGAMIANGTDTPVEDVDPIACFAASVTRKLADGSRFYPAQCMTRDEALRSYTVNGAYAEFESGDKGSLAVGKLADIVVLSKDILTCPEDEIRDAKVVHTILAGNVVYSAP